MIAALRHMDIDIYLSKEEIDSLIHYQDPPIVGTIFDFSNPEDRARISLRLQPEPTKYEVDVEGDMKNDYRVYIGLGTYTEHLRKGFVSARYDAMMNRIQIISRDHHELGIDATVLDTILADYV